MSCFRKSKFETWKSFVAVNIHEALHYVNKSKTNKHAMRQNEDV